MSLDITKVAGQVGEMLDKLKSDNRELLQRLSCAREKLADRGLDVEKLKRKIARARTTWLVPGVIEGLDSAHSPGPAPAEFSVLATDGSHIDIDRNRAARCFLINVGAVLLQYGRTADARLESFPTLYCRAEDMELSDERDPSQKRPLDSTLTGIMRGTEEMRYLADGAAALPAGSPALALVDGTLVRWGLEAYPEFVTRELVKKRFVGSMDRIRALNPARRVALASYISLSRATEVVNVLKVAICPQESPDCDRCQPIEGAYPCDAVDGVQDQMLFSQLLRPGERSALFFSQSSIQEKYYGQNRVYFYYLRLEDEVGRVEIPEWTALNPGLLELTHSLVLDQCRRGQGYPVALSEAHEQAVISGADREEFWALLQESMEAEKMAVDTSKKSQSKKTRWV